MSKIALITGITGQDGAYLSRLLLEKGYKVFGAYRRSSSTNLWRLKELKIDKEIEYVSMELLEFSNILKMIETTHPNEIYNLGAQSFVETSFSQPLFTTEVNAMGTLRILEAIKTVDPTIRFYQASTSEMFGKVRTVPQNENTPFYPRSPYGVSKLYAHWITINYREAYNLYACSGILFNHESPLRGLEFVTRKITSSLARIKTGKQEILELGNLNAQRDWGHAKDYTRGMWLMLQQNEPHDYVLATGETHSIREFINICAKFLDLNLIWKGIGKDEIACDQRNEKPIVRVNPRFYRPSEVEHLIGSASKAKEKLKWATTLTFEELAEEMMLADLNKVKHDLI